MVIFYTDLDNTLIYSYRRNIGEDKKCVELYQGREVSFVTERTWELLQQAREQVLLIPTTTRTREQYDRIDLGIGIPEYALVCNGGVLLVKGEEDIGWYQQSLSLIADCQEELKEAELLMEQDRNRSFEVRNIRNLFLFTKSDAPGQSAEYLAKQLDTRRVEVFQNGAKVYAVPKALSKGAAIERLCQRFSAGKFQVIAAGDSEFDVSMLQKADTPVAPKALGMCHELPGQTILVEETEVFSERVLELVIRQAKKE